MRADQIMTRTVVTIRPDQTIYDAAKIMLQHHISGLPVVDIAGKLVGIISESDFLHRIEIGTQKKRNRWLEFFVGPGKAASDYVREQGRKVGEVMTPDPHTVEASAQLNEVVEVMEKHHIKRLPVMTDHRLVGIVTRANLLQAVSILAGDVADPTCDDDRIRDNILTSIQKNEWSTFGLGVVVRDGVVHLSGVITDDRSRQASIVAAENIKGVKSVHDHLCWVDATSGMYLNSLEDERALRAV
jgi:CBS domain-containing protein